MNLADNRLKELDNASLTHNERVLLRCRLASEFIHKGQYETAREALGELWQGIGRRPEVERLKPLVAAEVLLQCGVLSGWLGRVQHVCGAQEQAKDLISEALRVFESQRQPSKVAESQYELGMCYFRLGAYDEARVVLDEALEGLGEEDADLRAKILIRHTLIEVWTGRYHDAWSILERAGEFFESCGDAIKGRWHGQKGLVLQRLALTEKREDYADRAIVEFTAAIYHYEQAGHERYCANNFNNLAMLLYQMGRHSEAHENLDRAQEIFGRHKDSGNLAQVNETRARVLVAEGRYKEADRIVSRVVQDFEKGGEYAMLADALTIRGVVLAKLGAHEESINTLRRAMSVAQDSGAFTNAGLAALTLIEEHGRERLSETELYGLYRRADDLLTETQDAEDIGRLRACARIVIERLSGVKLGDEDFSLPDVVRAYEAKFIEQALELEHGSLSHAAKRLGIKHQSLSSILKRRHKSLSDKRTPFVPRRRSIIPDPDRPARHPRAKQVRPATVLHVEDSKIVADTVRDTLEMEGLSVIICVSGTAALRMLEGKEHYDLLLLDNDLPHVSGIELIRRARQLPHRRHTPVIMLSAGDVETEAWKAGANAFLRKPDDIGGLAAMVKRLLAGRE
ncbi:MAG: response regulator [Acidobacteriota bacterium]|nr:response regulator [Acidobacteriota bacterium]